uniref:Uncharacterized protein n=1 Tax=viral metagenome TaxID=1070528 RepID=A0A6H2A5E0_9ZZZZ
MSKELVYLNLEMNGDGQYIDSCSVDEDPSLRVSNPDAENGYNECSGPLSWLNSAAIHVSSEEDAVSCYISVGDPRGAFTFTVRRTPDGELIIHMPHPDEGFAHMKTEFHHPGTLQVTGDFSDSEEEDSDEEDEE